MAKTTEWTREEILLALDLYLQFRDDAARGDAPIHALAALLDRDFLACDVVVRSFAWDDAKRPFRATGAPSEEARQLWQKYQANRAELKKLVGEIEGKLTPKAS